MNIQLKIFWHVLFTFDSEEKLKEFAELKLGLTEEKAKKFSKIKLQQGYATLSLSAIKKILPYLKKGFIYSKAVYMANFQKVLGTHEISEDFVNHFAEEIDVIYEDVSTKRKLNNVLNGLFREELISEGDYHLPENEDLDEADLNLIQQKIKDSLGEKSWDETNEELKAQYFEYVRNNYKEFLQKPLQAKKGGFMEQPRIHNKIFDYLQEHYQSKFPIKTLSIYGIRPNRINIQMPMNMRKSKPNEKPFTLKNLNLKNFCKKIRMPKLPEFH